MRAAALAIIALAGCNQVLGLNKQIEMRDAYDPYVGCSRPGDANYHDEDDDGYPDDCDNCPGIANLDQADMLETLNHQAADGVGDLCDPSPSITGDTIARFVSFAGPADMALLEPHIGSWSIAGGDLVAANATIDGSSISFAFTPPTKPYAVETHILIDQWDKVATISYFLGVYTNFTAGSVTNGQGECQLDRRWIGAGGHLDEIDAFITGAGAASSDLAAAKFGAGAGYVALATVGPTSLDCRFGGDLGDNAAGSNMLTMTNGKIGFEASRIAARFRYLVVYDMSGEPH